MRMLATVIGLGFLPFLAFSDEVTLAVSKTQYAPDEKITVSFSGFPGKAQDWITVVAKDASEDTYGEYFYTDGKKEGALTFAGLKPGEYEARGYFDWPDGGYKVQARIAISVSGDAVESPPPSVPPDKAASAPEGSVFFTRKAGGATDLFSVKLDGTELTQWTRLGDREECVRPRYSPNGGVLFLHVKGMDWGLSLLDRSTKSLKTLIKPARQEEVKAAAWSPDGRSLACTIGDGFKNDLFLLDLDGKRTKLTSIEGWKRDPLSWSGGGGSILFTLHPPVADGGGTDYTGKDVARVSAGGGEDLNLASDPGNSDAAAYSPDGKTIVYVHCGIQSEEGNMKVLAYPEIWVMAADGSGKKRLTDGKSWDYQPAWSPDGRSIAFISSRSAGHDNVFVMNADGTGVRQLTKQDYTKKMSPAWSRDGKSICYLSEASFKKTLHAVPAAGGDSVEIASDCVDFDIAD